GNQISVITDATFHSSRLHVLKLSRNHIARVTGKAFFNSTIDSLDLSGNKFDTLEKLTFSNIANLTKLDLSGNPKLKLSPVLTILGNNPQLIYLSLASNDYEDLPLQLFEKQGQLEFLNLSSSRLLVLFPHQLSHLNNL
ncbi:unnamed protein product, partial [Allacma fusca]